MSPSPWRRTFWLAGLLLLSCGGGAKPAEEPRAEPGEASANDESAPAEDKADVATEPKESKDEKSESSADVSDEERRTVLQLVLDDEELGGYLHVTEPGRFPLKVSGKDLPSGLTKASKPVVLVDSPEPKAAVLVITDVQIGKSRASVSYRYEIEGIQGTTTLDKGARGWEILRSRIVEHFRADPK